MSEDRDPVVSRAIESLRELPEVDSRTLDRVVATAASDRATSADDAPLLSPPRSGVRGWIVAVVATAAVLVGFAVRSALHAPDRDRAGATSAGSRGLTPIAASPSATLPIVQQFVFNSRLAHHVSVVGDFNGWDPLSAPMSRSPDGDMWSTTIPLPPGRHSFAFMVDDSIVALDPRAQKVRDPDLGVDASVVIVGRP